VDALIERRFDHVISLCGKAREVCPEFPERARGVHWSVPDPALAADTGQAGYPAFQRTAGEIDTRIRYLLAPLRRHEVQP
jgi:ArsR family transcriptional regulator, arsenate/arsenite/antimonite-responsive transcriptional repressor / arsenate reductase (thioredoxin)